MRISSTARDHARVLASDTVFSHVVASSLSTFGRELLVRLRGATRVGVADEYGSACAVLGTWHAVRISFEICTVVFASLRPVFERSAVRHGLWRKFRAHSRY